MMRVVVALGGNAHPFDEQIATLLTMIEVERTTSPSRSRRS
jgi:hypothetical protein